MFILSTEHFYEGPDMDTLLEGPPATKEYLEKLKAALWNSIGGRAGPRFFVFDFHIRCGKWIDAYFQFPRLKRQRPSPAKAG